MKLSKLSVFIFIFSIMVECQIARAFTTEIIDPEQLLKKVDFFVAGQTFESALTCGTVVTFLAPIVKWQFECGQNSCNGQYETHEGATLTKTTADCSATSAFIYSSRSDIDEVTRADFNLHSGNMARRILENMGDFLNYNLKVNIDRVDTATYTLNRGEANENTVAALNIFSSMIIEGSSAPPPILILSVIQNAPASAQVVRFRFADNTFYLLKGL